jgi:hypothetical protein
MLPLQPAVVPATLTLLQPSSVCQHLRSITGHQQPARLQLFLLQQEQQRVSGPAAVQLT